MVRILVDFSLNFAAMACVSYIDFHFQEVKMKWFILFVATTLVLSTGCKKEDDDVLIKDLLDNSQYSGATAVTDDETQTPKDAFRPETDSVISFIRFARYIQRPVTREVNLIITGDTATATIKAQLNGTFYVTDSAGCPIYNRTIQDKL